MKLITKHIGKEKYEKTERDPRDRELYSQTFAHSSICGRNVLSW